MKGEVIIDSKGEVSSSLPLSGEGAGELGHLITSILQDVNMYMCLGEIQAGSLKKTTLRLGNQHEVQIVVGADSIKASVTETA